MRKPKTISSREFNLDQGSAKKAAKIAPVFITNRGEPEHVLLSFEAYQKLLGVRPKMADLLASPATADLEFDAPQLRDLPRPADLS